MVRSERFSRDEAARWKSAGGWAAVVVLMSERASAWWRKRNGRGWAGKRDFAECSSKWVKKRREATAGRPGF